MSELALLVAELENGSTDLASCLSSRPDLSREDQLQLVLADQKYRVQRNEPCNAEHYAQLLPWLADDPTLLQQVIVNEFMLRLEFAPSDALLAQFTARYSQFGPPLVARLRALLPAEVKQTPQRASATGAIESLATQPLSRRVNPNDLTGTFISSHTVGDMRDGRYRFARKLGQGAYGAVYLAQDTDLKRQVAVKVPSREALEKLVDIDSYLIEAQNVAALDHPHIVTVYDVGRTVDGSIYVVSKFIDGCSLAEWIKKNTLDFQAIAKLSEPIAEALHHAHQRRLIHRDIKPANILIEESTGTPYVADFGLAIREEDYLQDGRIAGTPSYMSPEQVRGEGHRLDGRSDLFSLGVVMYLMLTGRLPFPGQTYAEIAHEITTVEPPAPRSLKTDIPAELERICLKLLRKRASERYANGRELAEDLRAWLTPRAIQLAKAAIQKITPRGLRSFTADDAGFFLDLLPGPRNRDGLPESIAFWKERIEQRDPDQTFTVGLLYGPSGCGKSSLVKAGLIPSLSPEVIAIYIEATPEETEPRMLRGLRKAIPELPEDLGLVDALKQLRRSEFKKVVFIIDQFEQWLYANSNYADAELTKALRQCDGEHVQGIVMIRDDFAMAAARFMDALDVPILQGSNFATVDLFDIDHARKVLIKFGQAFNRCPSDEKERTDQQNRFLDQVVSGLARDGKVVSVQIALFAEMVKDKPWVIATLEEVGGTEGIGVSFLEETFSARSANPKYKVHQQAARQLLGALLPEVGSDIKGHMRSHDALLQESIYKDRPGDFNELLRILDGQLRLITPTDPEGDTSNHSSQNSSLGTRFYQLTHDYLVPSLRDWLTRKQLETKKGRAELKLAERAAAWGVNKESKQLPTFVEWFQIRRLTESAKWKAGEKVLMRSATRHHTTRALLATTLAIALVLSGLGIKRWNDQRLMDRDAASLVSKIETADFGKLADEFKKLPALRAIVDPKLKAALEQTKPDSDERLKLSLALLPTDPTQLDSLVERLQSAQSSQVQLIVEQLRPHKEKILESMWSAIEGENKAAWLPVASALADYDPSNERWRGIAAKVSDNLVRDPLRASTWIELLRPAALQLNPELKQIYAATPDATRSQAQIDLATDILETYAAADFPVLHELILSGRPEQFARLFNEYEAFRTEALAQLRDDVARTFVPDSNASADEVEKARLQWIARQANAAVALMRLEDPQPVYQFLTVDRDPEALSQFIYRIRGREVSPSLLVKSFQELVKLPTPLDANERRQNILRLYGMILGLGEFTVDQLPTTDREGLIEQLSGIYGQHPNRAVHSALGWLLRRWGQEERVRAIDETPLEYDASGVREWYVMEVEPPVDLKTMLKTPQDADRYSIDPIAPIYFTMLVFPGGEFEMGEVGETEPVEISGPIAVSDREVTWRQFSPIDGDDRRQSWEKQFKKELGGRRLLPEEPVFGVSWFESVNYCRWLTAARMPGEKNQSYAKKEFTAEQSKGGWVSFNDPKDWEWPMDPKKPGFRLLTEREWEYVARGGMETTYSFGTSEALLNEYGWYDKNSGGWSHPTAMLRPSVAGLFDIHGNLNEWTDDWYTKGSYRVNRGGCWGFVAAYCRSALRSWYTPGFRSNDLGFRVALVPVASAEHQPSTGAGGQE
jgi:serine/threonine protein kinase/formylglycine-generating enzyme required for sulfatase activity